MSDLLRVYLDPAWIGPDGYPYQWHGRWPDPTESDVIFEAVAIKDLIRERDGHRCLRCGHPYEKGMGEWSPCDERCTHRDPVRWREAGGGGEWFLETRLAQFGETAASARMDEGPQGPIVRYDVEAQWRILTVHHLNGIKHDCRWWNLVSLCQRCHLEIQAKVQMEQVYPHMHTEWFKPFAAGYYAWAYLGEELTREQVDERLDELLRLELML